MGQEFLEDKYWSDSPDTFRDSLIWWDGLASDRAMQDHFRFVRELIALRRRHPGLRADGANSFHAHDDTRILPVHRSVEGVGRDVVVVAKSPRGQAVPTVVGILHHAGRGRQAIHRQIAEGSSRPDRGRRHLCLGPGLGVQQSGRSREEAGRKLMSMPVDAVAGVRASSGAVGTAAPRRSQPAGSNFGWLERAGS